MIGMLLSPALELTSDQQEAIRAILDAHKSIGESEHTALQDAENALTTYLQQGGSDSSEIAKYIAEISTRVTTLRTDEANIFINASTVLTDAQRETLSTLSVKGPGGH